MMLMMKKLIFITVSLFVPFNVFANWAEFKSKPGEFTVRMPCSPKLKKKIDHTVVGKITEHIYSCQKGKLHFVVEYQDLPPIAVSLGSRKRIYRNSKKAFLKDVKARELSFTEVNIKAFPGKELTYKNKKELGQARFFLIGKRLYVLQAYGPHNTDIKAFAIFFESFNQKFKKLFKSRPQFNKYRQMQSQHLH